MAIPVLNVPEDTIKLFSISAPVKVRPYLVGEEKLFLMAQQSEDPKAMEQAVKQVMRNCTFDKINVDKLPSFDLEYLFLQLRAKSVNNICTIHFECQNDAPTGANQKAPDGKCHATIPVSVDLNAIQIQTIAGHSNKIWLNDEVGILLKYPTVEMLEKVPTEHGGFTGDLIIACLDQIFEANGNVTEVADCTPDELQNFVNRLTLAQQALVQKFFDTMPTVSYTSKLVCPACKYEEEMVITGLLDFFV